MKNEKIITLVQLTVNPEFIQEVLPVAKSTSETILLEEGCEVFNLTTNKHQPNTLVIFAVYISKQTYEWHLEQDYVKSFFKFLEDKLITTPVVTYLEEV